MDELEMAKTARASGFVKAQAIGQGPDQAKLISLSIDEETGSWFNGYFAVILKSVTIDGWVVIGILMIMAVISWFVMFDKARYLSRQSKANAKFQRSFRQGTAGLFEGRDAAATSARERGSRRRTRR
jgi:biopolymer transport protein ExbB